MTKKIFAYAFLALVLLFVYAPIFVLIVFSFTDTTIIGQRTDFRWNCTANCLPIRNCGA